MQLEVGEILQGKVTGIAKYGVFVDIGSGKSGMVHISEVASAYVKEIRDYVDVGQEVKVKVVSVAEDGKISLSMKQAEDNGAVRTQSGGDRSRQRQERPARSERPSGYDRQQSEPKSFDEMLSRFMQTSDEKMSDLRRSTGERRVSRKGHHQ